MMRRTYCLSTVLLILIALLPVYSTAQSDDEARSLYDRGREALNDDRFQRAADLFGQVADRHEDSRYAADARSV